MIKIAGKLGVMKYVHDSKIYTEEDIMQKAEMALNYEKMIKTMKREAKDGDIDNTSSDAVSNVN